MTRGDGAVEKGADKLDALAGKAAAKGGLAAKLSDELADDAAFLRKLKPSLMLKRAKGDAPKDQELGSEVHAPSGPQHDARPTGKGKAGGPNPFLVTAGAFGLGALLAKAIDWRGHAHPRR